MCAEYKKSNDTVIGTVGANVIVVNNGVIRMDVDRIPDLAVTLRGRSMNTLIDAINLAMKQRFDELKRLIADNERKRTLVETGL